VSYPGAPEMAVTYAYDNRDRLINVSDTRTGTSLTFHYDDADRLTGMIRPNGVNGTYTYDARGLTTRIQEGSVLDLRYAYDAAGRCVEADFVAAPIDPTGAVTNGTNQFTYDNASQISTAGYRYDPRGRLTNAPNTTFTWDGASRLRSIDNVNFGYNALGEIVTRAEGGNTNRYFYNYAIGLAPIMAERNDATGEFTRFYVWSPGGLLLYIINLPGNSVHFPLFDRTGSTLALTDGTGAVTDAYAYNVYGRLLARTGPHPQPFQFVGRSGVRHEPAGHLAQMRARYYDPRTARFLSREPIWPVLEEPKKLNPYQYALQDPISLVDPEGTDEKPAETPVEEMSETELAIELFNRGVNRAESRPRYERGPPRGKLSDAELQEIAKTIKDFIKKLKRTESKWLEELRKIVKQNRESDKRAEERERARREEEERRHSEEMERKYRKAQRGGALIGPPVRPGGSQSPNPVPSDPTTPTVSTIFMPPQSPSPMSLSPKVRSLMVGPNGALTHQGGALFAPPESFKYRDIRTGEIMYEPDGPTGDFLQIGGDIR
jgi:RHS repeat-associated protein